MMLLFWLWLEPGWGSGGDMKHLIITDLLCRPVIIDWWDDGHESDLGDNDTVYIIDVNRMRILTIMLECVPVTVLLSPCFSLTLLTPFPY